MRILNTRVAFAVAGLGLLTGCGGDGGGTGPNPGITLSGFVRDRGGEPISGATVLVPGRSPVTSGPDGRFSVPDVAVPYDITIKKVT